MAGSIPGSDIAERAPAIARRAAPAPAPEQRWVVLRRAARTRLAPFGAAVLLAAVLVALGAPLLAPYDPLEQNLGQALARPGRAHLLGTDNVGRDVMSRVIWGTRDITSRPTLSVPSRWARPGRASAWPRFCSSGS